LARGRGGCQLTGVDQAAARTSARTSGSAIAAAVMLPRYRPVAADLAAVGELGGVEQVGEDLELGDRRHARHAHHHLVRGELTRGGGSGANSGRRRATARRFTVRASQGADSWL
jgi:hypothetical protein